MPKRKKKKKQKRKKRRAAPPTRPEPMPALTETPDYTFPVGPQAPGLVYYLHDHESDISGYFTAERIALDHTESTKQAVVNSGSGEVIIDEFASIVGDPGLRNLYAGVWHFNLYLAIDKEIGDTRLKIRVYKRTTGDVETELFTATSTQLSGSDPALYITEAVIASDFTLEYTDRLVFKLYAYTDAAPDITVTLYLEGTVNYSHIHTPIYVGPIGAPAPPEDHAASHQSGGGDVIDITGLHAAIHLISHIKMAENWTLVSGTWIKIPFDTIVTDEMSAWSEGNKNFTIPATGLYQFIPQLNVYTVADLTLYIRMHIDDVEDRWGMMSSARGHRNICRALLLGLFTLNEVVHFEAWHTNNTSPGSDLVIDSDPRQSFLTIVRLR